MTTATTATGKFIKKRRDVLEISQKSLAHKLGFTSVFLGKVEGGHADLPIKYIDTLCHELKVNRHDVFKRMRNDLIAKLKRRANV